MTVRPSDLPLLLPLTHSPSADLNSVPACTPPTSQGHHSTPLPLHLTQQRTAIPLPHPPPSAPQIPASPSAPPKPREGSPAPGNPTSHTLHVGAPRPSPAQAAVCIAGHESRLGATLSDRWARRSAQECVVYLMRAPAQSPDHTDALLVCATYASLWCACCGAQRSNPIARMHKRR